MHQPWVIQKLNRNHIALATRGPKSHSHMSHFLRLWGVKVERKVAWLEHMSDSIVPRKFKSKQKDSTYRKKLSISTDFESIFAIWVIRFLFEELVLWNSRAWPIAARLVEEPTMSKTEKLDRVRNWLQWVMNSCDGDQQGDQLLDEILDGASGTSYF